MKPSLTKIILVGGGGHCKVVIDAIRSSGSFEVVGIVDAEKDIGGIIEGVKVIGRDADLPKIFQGGAVAAFVTVGSLGDTSLRKKIIQTLKAIGFDFPVIVHTTAQVAPSAILESGAFVASGAIIQPGSRIGSHAIINTGAIVDHDCTIGSLVHVAPGAILSGGVTVGDDAHIGTGAKIIEGKTIGNGSLVGAGSVVVEDIPEFAKAYGNPCRVVK